METDVTDSGGNGEERDKNRAGRFYLILSKIK